MSETIDDVLRKSDVFQSMVNDSLRDSIRSASSIRKFAEGEVFNAIRQLHKLMEAEENGRTEWYWYECDRYEFQIAEEFGLVEQGSPIERGGRIVHYYSATQYGRGIHTQIMEAGYDFGKSKPL